jgi:hypothetical protein
MEERRKDGAWYERLPAIVRRPLVSPSNFGIGSV